MKSDRMIMAGLAAVIMLCAILALGDLLSYGAGRSEYDRLKGMMGTEGAVSNISDSTDPGAGDGGGGVESGVGGRFDFLYSINPDFVGVLSLPCLDLTYPVVQGKDNEKYLETTFEGRENPAGCIFMDCENSKDLRDPVTYIYGHNMKDGSMFGKLRKFLTEEELTGSKPKVVLSTSEGDHEYIFKKAEVVDVRQPPPKLQGDEKQLVLYTCYGRSGDKKLLVRFSDETD